MPGQGHPAAHARVADSVMPDAQESAGPPPGSLAPGTGNLIVQVQDQAGNGLSGLPVTV